MTRDRFNVLEGFAPMFEAPEPSFEGFLRRRDRKLRNQRIAAGVIAIAVFVLPFVLFAVLDRVDRSQTPAASGSTGLGFPDEDYVIDLNTGEMSPLPRAIHTLAGNWSAGEYAVSPDGSQLAFTGSKGQGASQIYIAGLDGTGVRRVTDDPEGASSPAWSPDGTRIAYEGFGSSGIHPPVALFVLDVATGESTHIVESTRIVSVEGGGPPWPLSPQFTPDGSSLIYTGGSTRHLEVRTVPVSGGKSELLVGAGGGLTGAWNGTLSPDGALLTFLDGQPYGPGARRWVVNSDGTERRLLPEVYGIRCVSNPAGTWSPDGSRIVCSEASMVVVIDIETGEASAVARGRGAIWLDDHSLLVSL